MNIRHATQNDFNSVRLLDPHSKHIDPKKIETKIDAEEIILAFNEDEPVGLIKFSYLWSVRPFIDLIWIKEGYRSNGIGKKLLDYLEQYLVKNGHSYLMSSSQKNELPPQEWHLKQGFLPCGELTSINLPEADIPEMFFYKRIGD